jgi:RNA polymerase sigma factor (sigma-70 family)
MPDHPTDAALVAAARSGSDADFAKLVDRHQQAVRGFLRRICGHEADADDLAQETFLAAWTSLRTLKTAAHLKTWLFAIAWRKAKGLGRSASRSRIRDHAWSELQDDRVEPSTEMNIAMQQAMAQLSSEQRAVVALCLAGGWSHGDAALALNMPLGTVKSHVTRGRGRLIEILGVNDDQT